MASEVIDFPEPDSPTRPSTSPAAMENERSRTAATTAQRRCRRKVSGRKRLPSTGLPELNRQIADVKQRAHESHGSSAATPCAALLLRPRFRRHQSGDAVVNDQLAVVFAGMLEQAPSHIGDAHLLIREWIDDQIVHSLVALLLDRGRSVGKCFLHKLTTTAAFVLYWSRLGSSSAGGFSPIAGFVKK